MKTEIQSIHFNADHKLIDFIRRKALKLEQHFIKIIYAEVFLKLEKSDGEKNKVTEIKLHIPGSSLFAKAHCKTFEEATDLVIQSLVKQLDKKKLLVA